MINKELFKWKRQVTNIQDVILQQLAGKQNKKLAIIYTDRKKRDKDLFNFIKAFDFMITDLLDNKVFLEHGNQVNFSLNKSKLNGKKSTTVIFNGE